MPLAGLLSLGRRTSHVVVIRHGPHSAQLSTIFSARRRLFSACPRVKTLHQDASPGQLSSDYRVIESLSLPEIHQEEDAGHTPLRASDNASLDSVPWHLLSPPQKSTLVAILKRRIHQLDPAEPSGAPSGAPSDAPSEHLALDQQPAIKLHDDIPRRVNHWLQILTTPNSLHAASLLTTATDPPPFFVLHQLLDREFIRPEALKLLLLHLPRWHSSALSHASSDANHIDSSLMLPIFARLLRHCRQVWPQAIESLAVSLTHYLSLPTSAQGRNSRGDIPTSALARLTLQYNRALRLFSRHCSIAPFKNAVFQEAAQAVLLKHMADHNPPLVINREGYRAVTRIQLANKKTSSEQEWARLKSPSWPPWKEDRTGMDAHVGLEYGVSRAHHILNRMQEAGYPFRSWERVAMVYAGWDTDHSPTIQTRTILPHFPPNRFTQNLWVARIRTARTAQQAWACFLAYQDEHLPPDPYIYQAMLKVLVQERKRLRFGEDPVGHEAQEDGPHPLYPGDTREIGSPPSSAHQLTYVRAEIPSIQQLYDLMREDGIQSSDATLVLLLDTAESLSEGLAYMTTSSQRHQDAISSLLSSDVDHQIVQTLPDSIFSAYIRLLCRFPHTPLENVQRTNWRWGDVTMKFQLNQPLSRALHLLVEQKRTFRPAWNNVFDALARRTAPALGSSWRNLYLRGHESLKLEMELHDKIFAYNLAIHVVVAMRSLDLILDADAFLNICVITEHAASAANNIFEHFGTKPESAARAIDSRLIEKAVGTMKEAPKWIQEKFSNLVEGAGPAMVPDEESSGLAIDAALPRLFTVPGPAVLHAHVRALGLLRDFEGLEKLVHWMIRFQCELAERRSLDRRGVIMMRRTLTALRVFLEGKWQPLNPTHDNDELPSAATSEKIAELAAAVNSVQVWGGWPSEEEVAMYVDIGHGVEER